MPQKMPLSFDRSFAMHWPQQLRLPRAPTKQHSQPTAARVIIVTSMSEHN